MGKFHVSKIHKIHASRTDLFWGEEGHGEEKKKRKEQYKKINQYFVWQTFSYVESEDPVFF